MLLTASPNDPGGEERADCVLAMGHVSNWRIPFQHSTVDEGECASIEDTSTIARTRLEMMAGRVMGSIDASGNKKTVLY